MSQPDNTPYWLAWVAPIGACLGALWAFLRRFFAMATREELRQAILDAQQKVDLRHEENRNDVAGLKEDITQLTRAVARIEGQLSGRYPNLGKR